MKKGPLIFAAILTALLGFITWCFTGEVKPSRSNAGGSQQQSTGQQAPQPLAPLPVPVTVQVGPKWSESVNVAGYFIGMEKFPKGIEVFVKVKIDGVESERSFYDITSINDPDEVRFRTKGTNGSVKVYYFRTREDELYWRTH